MNSAWSAILWKEFREAIWKFVALLAIFAAVFAAIAQEDVRPETSLLLLYLYPLAAGLFVGITAATAEGSRGTLPFLRSLPLALWKVAAVRLALGYIAAVTPPLVLIALVTPLIPEVSAAAFPTAPIPPSLSAGGPMSDMGVWCLLMTLNIYLWTAALSVGRSDEVRGAATTLIIMAAWSIACGLVDNYYNGYGPTLGLIGSAILGAGPTTYAFAGSQRVDWNAHWLISAFVLPILAWWFLRTYGRIAPAARKVLEPETSHGNAPLLAARQSPLTALAWKQFRESAPIVLTGLGGVALTTAIFAGAEFSRRLTLTQVLIGTSELYDIAVNALLPTLIFFGFVVATVVGVGAFVQELGPGLSSFWRSRPISPTQLFAIKYATGLAAVLLPFVAPLLYLQESLSAETGLGLALTASMGATFAVSAMFTCVLRNAIYASILGLGATISVSVYASTKFETLFPLTVIALAALVLATLIAWASVRWDLALRY